jgi:hypothetical protein
MSSHRRAAIIAMSVLWVYLFCAIYGTVAGLFTREWSPKVVMGLVVVPHAAAFSAGLYLRPLVAPRIALSNGTVFVHQLLSMSVVFGNVPGITLCSVVACVLLACAVHTHTWVNSAADDHTPAALVSVLVEDDDSDCSICLLPMLNGPNSPPLKSPASCAGGHAYHAACIERWTEVSTACVCPLCGV